jgi:hypothetical protein
MRAGARVAREHARDPEHGEQSYFFVSGATTKTTNESGSKARRSPGLGLAVAR